jgi:beta-alanine--pyruvate transaminase
MKHKDRVIFSDEIGMACWQKGLYVRFGGDTLQLAPPFISEKADIDRLVSIVDDALKEASS